MRTKTIYIGNCPQCRKKQESTDKSEADIICWECAVNANLERDDIKRDIEQAIKEASIVLRPGLIKALEIVKKYGTRDKPFSNA